MKLALFHTVFNILGVLLVSPFTNKLEIFLKTLFRDEKISVLKAKYLDDIVIAVPSAAIKAIKNETIHLYENSIEVISHALYLHRHKYLGSHDISLVVKNSNAKINIDINEFYSQKIKSLYGEIIHFSVLAQSHRKYYMMEYTGFVLLLRIHSSTHCEIFEEAERQLRHGGHH